MSAKALSRKRVLSPTYWAGVLISWAIPAASCPTASSFRPEQVLFHAFSLGDFPPELFVDAHQPVAVLLAADGGAQPGRKDLALEGLGNVVVGARFQPPDDVFVFAPGRDQEHGDRPQPLVLFQLAQHLEAVHAGHHHVQENGVDGFRRGQAQRLLAAGGREDLVLLVLHDLGQQSDHVGRVVHYQNLRHCGGSLLSPFARAKAARLSLAQRRRCRQIVHLQNPTAKRPPPEKRRRSRARFPAGRHNRSVRGSSSRYRRLRRRSLRPPAPPGHAPRGPPRGG